MVNIPYRSSDALAAAHIAAGAADLRRTAGALVLAFAAALLAGAVLSHLVSQSDLGLPNLIPFDDPIALSTFTA